MCGIVGLFIKSPKLEPELGALLATMLEVMSDRGPDSAGFAVYGDGRSDRVKLSLHAPGGADFQAIAATLEGQVGTKVGVTIRSSHAILEVPAERETALRDALGQGYPLVTVVGTGARMEIYKEVGQPADVARRFDLSSMAGTHGVGHTRMATESAITTAGAHPFSTGRDQCLVHNGSLSNHNSLRRTLRRDGVAFGTDNDSEVAAGYLTWRLRQGDSLKRALTSSLDTLDGFYTFVVGTESGFAVLRDPISCKPAVMAETDDYVAFGSEYRALADLPGIARARVWEPEPATVYSWERAA
ncbi:glutamine amidotransferase [Skermanella stibiiresistens SB22]|uniref:Glutamine amidotransferase n=1 Tax=Skermanella stibiiresistens SB22 TaxID=1385369 RepID=W9H3T2_9PROT|nr:glutamine amidotransferase family protein [Skermanella stibiiresistens]EWY40855.1 glutamine amidotransferase [Skermanella stibiiresistens SB22]